MISLPPYTVDLLAQELCRVRGLDPYMIQGYDGHNSNVANLPMWQIVRVEVVAFLEIQEAMRHLGLT